MLDLTKPLATRDGQSVRLLCTDAKGSFPVVGLIYEEDRGVESPSTWTREGKWRTSPGPHRLDLVNAPVLVQRWLLTYSDGSTAVFLNEKTAVAFQRRHRSSRPKPLLTMVEVEVPV